MEVMEPNDTTNRLTTRFVVFCHLYWMQY